MRVLVTGANGFVGRALCDRLVRHGCLVRAASRGNDHIESCESVRTDEVGASTMWEDALRDVDVVIHLAARVHVMHEGIANPLEEFRRVNVAGTVQLARVAADTDVKRLVYVSTIKVNGDATSDGRGFSEDDPPAPEDAYAVSKWEAEQVLWQIAQETGMEVVIVRPPLVYGPGVKGNFAQMLRVLAKRIPLPLASVHNLRSLIYVGNLVDALIVCATHPAAAGQTYLVSDGEDISTPGLLRQLGAAMGRPALLFSCPPALLSLAGQATGKADRIERLLGSLRVDSGKIRRELDWTPPYPLRQGLQETAEWYRNTHP